MAMRKLLALLASHYQRLFERVSIAFPPSLHDNATTISIDSSGHNWISLMLLIQGPGTGHVVDRMQGQQTSYPVQSHVIHQPAWIF
jgi:hypothetical protein